MRKTLTCLQPKTLPWWIKMRLCICIETRVETKISKNLTSSAFCKHFLEYNALWSCKVRTKALPLTQRRRFVIHSQTSTRPSEMRLKHQRPNATCWRVHVCVCVCVCVCQRKTKDRADGMREKSAFCPRRDSNLYLWDTRPPCFRLHYEGQAASRQSACACVRARAPVCMCVCVCVCHKY